MAIEAFDLAERLQTPVFVMIDLDLGMNTWMSEPFAYPEKPIDRGKRADGGEAAGDSASGAATRTWTATASRTGRSRATGCPPTSAAGPGHNERGQYSERPADYVANIDRLDAQVRHGADAGAAAGRRTAPRAPASGSSATARATGASSRAATSCAQRGGPRDVVPAAARLSLRRRSVQAFVAAHDRVYVVEQNRDGQMAGAARRSTSTRRWPTRLRSVLPLRRPAARRAHRSPTRSWRRQERS